MSSIWVYGLRFMVSSIWVYGLRFMVSSIWVYGLILYLQRSIHEQSTLPILLSSPVLLGGRMMRGGCVGDELGLSLVDDSKPLRSFLPKLGCCEGTEIKLP